MFRLDAEEAKKTLTKQTTPTLQRFQQVAGSLLIDPGNENAFRILREAYNTLGAMEPFQPNSMRAGVGITMAKLLAFCQAQGIDATDELRKYLLKGAS